MSQTVSVPGVGDLEFPDGMSHPDMAAAIQKNYPQIHGPQASAAQAPQQTGGFSDWLKSAASQIVRPVANAVSGLPLMAMDAGVEARNFLEHPHIPTLHEMNPFAREATIGDYPRPSAMFQQGLDSVTQAPTTTLGKVSEFVNSVLAGGILQGTGALPNMSPQVSAGDALAPEGFIPPAQARVPQQQSLGIAQRQGLVVPPSQSNPTFTNRLMEGISGKLKLNQEAMQANQPQFTRIASQEIGLNPDAPLNQGALAAVRQDAVQNGYAPLRNLGTITPTDKYTEALDGIVKATQGASRSFPGIKSPDVAGIVEPLRQRQFEASDAIDAISVLRGQADEAYSSGASQAGRAYKAAAKALEDAIEQHVTDQGEGGAGLLQAFRDARTTIAKSINIGKALNEGTGQVSATKIAQQAARGAPFTGGLRDIATFAQAYPKVSREVTDIFPSISPLDAYGSTIAAGAAHSAAPLAIPLTRVGIREYLLSGAGQARAVPQVASQGNAALGVLNAIPQFGLARLR